MNKELEALATIEELAFYLSVTNTPKNNKILAQADKILRQALKRNEPMKVDMMEFELCSGELLFRCPNCRRTWHLHYGDTFCKDCGQRLDWSDEK